ncbi:hypothetical protein V5F53_20890 [Xanthobacter sp. V4C-4]|uniref:capsular polysaccharide export protein, LipB/KpsS family n=1 Tax=Xanthobacter cornucopiae TaxID=3119924 RepID=UPI003727CFD9
MTTLTTVFSNTSAFLNGLFKKKPARPKLKEPVRESKQPAMVVPGWYRPHPAPETKRFLTGDKPVFLYMPWIAEHTDALIARLGTNIGYELVPFDMFLGIEDNATRREIFRFAQENTDTYRKLVVRRLVQLRKNVRGIIFTFDWTPVTHVIANVCEELQIPKILIPHESVFVDRDKYYWDPTAKASIPVADVVLGWGRLQQDIFLERGYPADRFRAVGAPKFDPYVSYQPFLTRAQFCGLYGLNPDRRLILFATQPLDSQLDTRLARKSQRQAIHDLFAYAQANDCQLMVRLPPSKDDVLGTDLRRQLTKSPLGAVDDAHCYLVNPEEALYHADVVSSVNSTMLFEAALLGRPALSMKYVEFDQIWEQVGIPAARNPDEMAAHLKTMLAGEWTYPPEGMAWAADMFGIGSFDGRASARIGAFLGELADNPNLLTPRPNAVERLFARQRIDVLGVPPATFLSEARQPNLLALLNARTRVDSRDSMSNLKSIASVDLFVQWGVGPSAAATEQTEAARALGRSVVVVEDGFIGAPEGDTVPAISLILDDTTAYYDATRASRLERWLAGEASLSAPEQARARAAIDKLVATRVTKDNRAPDLALNIGTAGRRKVLVVDQAIGDPAVPQGLADATTFERMLREVIANYEDCDILVKQHSNPAKSENASYLESSRLPFAKFMTNIHQVNFDINPYALLDLVDEVFVVSSNLGFEALLAGKTVHCYGLPFYAGWGLTEDRVTVERRARTRSVEDVFHAAYIQHSRYFHPLRQEAVAFEDIVDYVVENRV